MEALSHIQETIQDHQKDMPTGAVQRLMEDCQRLYNDLPKVKRVHYIKVFPVSKHEVRYENRCMAIEEYAFAKRLDAPRHWPHVFKEGVMPPNFADDLTCFYDNGALCIVTKVEPLSKRKALHS